MELSADRKPSGFWKRQDVREMLGRYVRKEIDLDAATDFVEGLCRQMQVNQPREALIEDVKWYAGVARKEPGLEGSKNAVGGLSPIQLDWPSHNLQDALYARLRRKCGAPSSDSVPVLFFGDPPTCKIATIGLNPGLCQDRLNRLGCPTLSDRAQLTEDQCRAAIRSMRRYFSAGLEGWFARLNRVAGAWGCYYERGEVIHLDLVQEQSKKWAEVQALHGEDGLFLKWEIESFQSIATILCNGQTVSNEVCFLLGVTIAERGTMTGVSKSGAQKCLHWFAGSASLNHRLIRVAGWNKMLGRAGLTPDEEANLGRLLESRFRTPRSS